MASMREMAWMMSSRGKATPGAAVAAVPMLLTKYVSARLYREDTIWLAIAGSAMEVISLGTGSVVIFKNRTCGSAFITQFSFFFIGVSFPSRSGRVRPDRDESCEIDCMLFYLVGMLWQATRWLPPMSVSCGMDCLQASVAYLQRGWKGQPVGALMGLGTSPSSTTRLRSFSA